MKSKKRFYLPFVLMMVGLVICLLPLSLRMLSQLSTNEKIQSYKSDMASTEDKILSRALSEAKEYNEYLYQTKNAYVFENSRQILSDEHYQELLNLSHNGIMGSLEIPKINVYLPIYHGTSEASLSNGVGHVQNSSLPVGGVNSRAFLTGHRGLYDAQLFSRLDELEKGDLFYIEVLNQVLSYQVTKVEVFSALEAEKQNFIPGKDCVTLITCTPYGQNTHRIFVTGERIEGQKQKKNFDLGLPTNAWELASLIIPVVAIIMVLAFLIPLKKDIKPKHKKRRKK